MPKTNLQKYLDDSLIDQNIKKFNCPFCKTNITKFKNSKNKYKDYIVGIYFVCNFYFKTNINNVIISTVQNNFRYTFSIDKFVNSSLQDLIKIINIS